MLWFIKLFNHQICYTSSICWSYFPYANPIKGILSNIFCIGASLHVTILKAYKIVLEIYNLYHSIKMAMHFKRCIALYFKQRKSIIGPEDILLSCFICRYRSLAGRRAAVCCGVNQSCDSFTFSYFRNVFKNVVIETQSKKNKRKKHKRQSFFFYLHYIWKWAAELGVCQKCKIPLSQSLTRV